MTRLRIMYGPQGYLKDDEIYNSDLFGTRKEFESRNWTRVEWSQYLVEWTNWYNKSKVVDIFEKGEISEYYEVWDDDGCCIGLYRDRPFSYGRKRSYRHILNGLIVEEKESFLPKYNDSYYYSQYYFEEPHPDVAKAKRIDGKLYRGCWVKSEYML